MGLQLKRNLEVKKYFQGQFESNYPFRANFLNVSAERLKFLLLLCNVVFTVSLVLGK